MTQSQITQYDRKTAPEIVFEDSPTMQVRNALAINRGIVALRDIENDAIYAKGDMKRFTMKDHASEVLEKTYKRIHENIFQDWHTRNDFKPGEYVSREAQEAMRGAIKHMLCTNGDAAKHGHQPDGLFDENGYVVSQNETTLAKTLAKFYIKMRDIKPFAFGNELALDMFVVAIGKLPRFKEVFSQGIDYRRMNAEDIQAVRSGQSELAIAKAFEHSLDFSRTPKLRNKPNGYGTWERHEIELSGNRFLAHERDGQTYLVTVNGGLVKLTQELKQGISQHMSSGGILADIPEISKKDIEGYLPGTQELRAPSKTEVDGINVQGEKVPLFCLSQNILTGLGEFAEKELMTLMKKTAGQELPVFSLANNTDLRDSMKHMAAGDEKLQRIVDVAYERVSRLTSKLDAEKAKIFEEDKPEHERTIKPVENPKLFMCMGGAGVGKTSVKNMTKAQCGDNFVEASLDDFRSHSDLYTLLMAAKHHGDDYKTVEPFANALRTFVADHARANHYNTLYDGTGIEYQPRYAKIVDNFKKQGFSTNVVGIDTPLISPPGREDEFDVPALDRVKLRQQAVGRALPWTVVVDKHIDTAKSFIEAAQHQGLDKLSLFANDRGQGKHYLVAESFELDKAAVKDLMAAKSTRKLAQKLGKLAEREDSALAAAGEPEEVARGRLSAAGADHLREENVSFLSYPAADSSKKRVLVVYDNERFVDMLEKGHLNKEASGPEGLLHKSDKLSFHASVPVNVEEPWKLRLRNAGDVSAEKER